MIKWMEKYLFKVQRYIFHLLTPKLYGILDNIKIGSEHVLGAFVIMSDPGQLLLGASKLLRTYELTDS